MVIMNKKNRKVIIRHDRHVVSSSLKTIIDVDKLPVEEETDLLLYEEKKKIREPKRNG
jgi:hypothetical protein